MENVTHTPKYEVVFFDLYGTLIDIRTDEQCDAAWQALYDTACELGAQYDSVEALRERFEKLEAREMLHQSNHAIVRNGWDEVGFMFGMYKKLSHEFTGTFTGKGREFGGSLIRPEATGYGNIYFLMEMLKTKGTDLKGKVCLISGSGNVAQYTAEKVLELGGKVVTMSDSDGYIYDPDGIDRAKLDYIMELKNLYRGRIREYAETYGCKYVEGARPWGEKGDIALPSATQNELNGDDARKLVANGVMAVSEGANMPSTPEAIKVFQDAKILYAPGKAANAGGVSVSGLEMTQNSIKLSWSSEEVDEKLKSIMKNIHEACVQYGTEPDGYVNYVKGANVAGFMKVAKAMMAQGIL